MMMPLVLFYYLKLKQNSHEILLCKKLYFWLIFTFRILIALLIHSNSLNTSQFDKKQNSISDKLKLIWVYLKIILNIFVVKIKTSVLRLLKKFFKDKNKFLYNKRNKIASKAD